MLNFTLIHPKATYEMLGIIPFFLSEADPAPARDQLNTAYAHGGGWQPFEGFTMLDNKNLQYPGDPQTKLLAEAKLRDEIIRVYEYSWVAVVQPNGDFEVCRMD